MIHHTSCPIVAAAHLCSCQPTQLPTRAAAIRHPFFPSLSLPENVSQREDWGKKFGYDGWNSIITMANSSVKMLRIVNIAKSLHPIWQQRYHCMMYVHLASLSMMAQQCLGSNLDNFWSAQYKIFFFSTLYTISISLSPSPSNLRRQSCRAACLWMCISGCSPSQL